MFEDQTQPQGTPLNPIMPAPGMSPTPTPPMAPPAPTQAAPIHTMPERFRAAGGGGQPSGGKGSTKKLVIILVVVLVVGGLGFAGLYVFRNVLNKSNANTNTVVINRTNQNTNNLNLSNSSSNLNLSNENTNGNANANANGNLNSNTEPSNTNSTVTPASPLPSSLDTDADGLTDVEEAVYGTDPAKADTDGDTFIDGEQKRSDGSIVGELYLGYNPKGTGPLEGSGLVKRVENATKTYSLLMPSSWTGTADQSGGILINPTQQTGEFFQTNISDNPNKLSPKDWYKTNNPTANVDQLMTIAVNGLDGVYSEDLSTVYLLKDTKVYSIHYDPGSLTQVNYRTTFDMMVRSFRLVAS